MDSRAPGFPTRFRKANRSDLVHAASGENGIDEKTHQWVHPLGRRSKLEKKLLECERYTPSEYGFDSYGSWIMRFY